MDPKSPAPAVVDAPAVGVSIICSYGKDRQITLQTFFGRDDPPAQVHKLMDTLNGQIDRLKAKAEIPEMEEELFKLEKTLAQFREDLELTHPKEQEKIDALTEQAKAFQAEGDAIAQQAYAEFKASGRQGSFQPKGVVKTNIERKAAEVLRIEDMIRTAKAEGEQARFNLNLSVKRYEEEIVRLKDRIDAAKLLADQ